ncbi:MAG TPA: hypothetical protein VJN22_05860 [Candidatus Eremiobacteraceae bacterium]|nr:hypothetical protein [Candidatus Eremiobacteraceae bacterium]
MTISSRVVFVLAVAGSVAACSSNPTVDQGPVTAPMSAAEKMQTPPPNTSTPVPIIRAQPLAGAGRTDPFSPLFSTAVAASSSSGKSVSVSAFPHIPTLPGFEGAPKSGGSIWDNIQVTGIVFDGGYTAIVTDNGASYIVHPGDYVANKLRVVAIGPDSVTLATNKEERHFSLGG